jgi:GNAT superfamily N-acetyltransferase
MLTIKKATITDIPIIRELTYQVWPATYLPIVGKQQLDYMLDLFYSPEELGRQMEMSNHRFILCFDDLEPVAFASYSEIETGIFKLHKLYILPVTQGKGIGRYLIQFILDELKTEKANLLRLNVNRFNKSAIGFYTKLGFRHLKDEDIDIGNGFFMNDHVLEIGVV